MTKYTKEGKPIRSDTKKRTKPDDTYSVWDKPTCRFDSQYGNDMAYLTWCIKEKERLAERGKFVEIITADDGEIALTEIKKEE